MPRIWQPRKSDAHRIACASLYRALLHQCNDLNATTAAAGQHVAESSLSNLVRYRFRRDSKLKSPHHIRDALTRGQQHLTLLHDATSGSTSALKQLASVLRTSLKDAETTAIQRALQSTRQGPQKITSKSEHIRKHTTKALLRPSPDSPGLSAHPLPLSALKSKSRIVPSLVGAQKNIAFLRYGKQPLFLGRVIRNKQEWTEKSITKMEALGVDYEQALAEDKWDEIIHQQVRAEKGDKAALNFEQREVFPHWVDAIRDSRSEIYQKQKGNERKAAEQGMKMWTILKQERRLKNWEDLPINVAKAIRKGRRLEVDIHKYAERHETKYRFTLRSHNEAITEELEAKKMGRFEVPVEYAVREEDTDPEYWAKLEESLTSQNPNAAQAGGGGLRTKNITSAGSGGPRNSGFAEGGGWQPMKAFRPNSQETGQQRRQSRFQKGLG